MSTEFTILDKNQERILEAIDQLRRRKARPDIQRICNYLFRRFCINSSEAKAELQYCVDRKIVRKVEYKGSISYRNATKSPRNSNATPVQSSATPPVSKPKPNPISQNLKPTKPDKHVMSQQQQYKSSANRKFVQLLTNAIGELIVQEPDYLEFGVPDVEIIDNILSKDSVRYTRKYISILLEKQVNSGDLVKTEEGNYMLAPENKDRPITIVKEIEPNGSERRDDVTSADAVVRATTTNASQQQQQQQRNDFVIHLKPRKRPGPKAGFRKEVNMDSDEKKSDDGMSRVGRRKRAKKVFDPSDTHIPKKRGRPTGSLNRATIEKIFRLSQNGDETRPSSRASSSNNSRDNSHSAVCTICNNKKGANDRMISCRECISKVHISCLENADDSFGKLDLDNSWQCAQCKTCVACYEAEDAGPVIICSACSDGYHAICHNPPILAKYRNSNTWICMNCESTSDGKPDIMRLNRTNSFTDKNPSFDGHSSASGSGQSSPYNYRSPAMSPRSPPHLSPQMILNDSRDGCNSKDSFDFEESQIDPSIPDATNWTYDEVYDYFVKYFPNEAIIFKEQEIDGRSLLLLKRMDVLTSLNLKLGPALKIYKHVVKLQVRRDDPKLYWL